jgi:hypothetical protein
MSMCNVHVHAALLSVYALATSSAESFGCFQVENVKLLLYQSGKQKKQNPFNIKSTLIKLVHLYLGCPVYTITYSNLEHQDVKWLNVLKI